jgi:hypothetical protein
MLVLFGVTWIGIAAAQPIPVYTTCYNGFPSPTGYPTCGLNPTALLYYTLGVAGIILGVVLVLFAFRPKSKPPGS